MGERPGLPAQMVSDQGDLGGVAIPGDDVLRAAVGRGREDMRAAGEVERHHRRAQVSCVVVVLDMLCQRRDGAEQSREGDDVLEDHAGVFADISCANRSSWT